MVVSSTFRLVLDLVYLIVLPIISDNSQNCIEEI